MLIWRICLGLCSATLAHAELPCLHQIHDIENWSRVSVESIQEKKEQCASVFMQEYALLASQDIDLHRWDQTVGNLFYTLSFFEALTLVHPDRDIRNSLENGYQELYALWCDTLMGDTNLYEKWASFSTSSLSLAEKYYVEQVVEDMQYMGCHLPADKRCIMAVLQKQIAAWNLSFQTCVREEEKSLWLSKEDLEGVSESVLEGFARDAQGLYEVSCDYPSYMPVISHAKKSKTRQKLYQLFHNRGYPSNESTLLSLLQARQKLAQLHGFSSFAAYDLQRQMAKKVQAVEQFLQEVSLAVSEKASKEMAQMALSVSESIGVDQLGRISPSDSAFILQEYKAKTFGVEEEILAEYFPLDHVLGQMMRMYGSFFQLQIERAQACLWDESVILLQVKDALSSKCLGYMALDLFPRKGKFSHACEATLSPAYKDYPAYVLVVTNFSSPRENRPSLLTHDQLRTLFHEFGHALHDILGRTDFLMTAGTRVKTDFVELPSQLLEEWVLNPEVLQTLSSHYQTRKPLSKRDMEALLASKECDIALSLHRQCYLSSLSLAYYSSQDIEEPSLIARKLKAELLPYYIPEEDTHFPCAFTHLGDYGPKYYGYLFAKVFALDIFQRIEAEGIANPLIGIQYKQAILEKGGSQDPSCLLEDFLGHPPSLEGLLQKLGH